MNPLHERMNGVLVAAFAGLLLFAHPAAAQLVSREQIVDALTMRPSFADRLRHTRSPTLDNRDYVLANAHSEPAIDLHEIYFEYNSAVITADAEPQLRELGAALTDSRLKGSTILIGGHTDAVGGDAFNQRLSERRAATVKRYLADNFALSPSNLRAVGYGRQRPKNRADLFAPENRRVEIVNETSREHGQH